MRVAALALVLIGAPVSAQLVSPLNPAGSTSGLATKAEVAAVEAKVPTAATSAPPSVADASATGNGMGIYALWNHTHASKARKGRVLVPVAGTFDVAFTAAFTNGVAPLCAVTAETTAGDINVVNAQIDGATTATGMRIRITRTAITAVSLLGLSVLSVPTQQATYAHYICIEP